MANEIKQKPKTFEQELECLLNSHGQENESNTPDFILAEYMTDCLKAFNTTCKKREKWYDMHCEPGGIRKTSQDHKS